MKKLVVCVVSTATIGALIAVSAGSAGAAEPTCFNTVVTHTSTSSFDPKTGVTTITGTAGNDAIVGTAGEDLIYGLGGDDKLCGGNDADLCDGGPGKNSLVNCP